MSERKADVIDAALLQSLHAVGLATIHGGEGFRQAGDEVKAERYRRIGQMLIGIATQTRDPLLVALWEHTGRGRTRIEWSNEHERREAAAAAVYLLLKFERRKTLSACKEVAQATGEKVETLRERFKGAALVDYEESQYWKYTDNAIQNMARLIPAPVHWKAVYDLLILSAAYLAGDLEVDRKRLSKIGESPRSIHQ